MSLEANKQISISVDKYLCLLHELVAAGNSQRQTGKRKRDNKQRAETTTTIKMKFATEPKTIRRDFAKETIGPSELASWRRFNSIATGRRQQSTRATGRGQEGAVKVLVCVALLVFVINAQTCESRELSSQMTFIPSVQTHYQQPIQLTPMSTTTTTTTTTLSTHATTSLLDRCKIGAPLQWRPYLDASNKAYLAPVVAIASLEHFALSPMQLATGASSQRATKGQTGATNEHHLRHLNQQPESLLQHAQSVNNAGVLIEATFQVRNVLRRPTRGTGDSLQAGRLIQLHYKVSASLATTSDIIALANYVESQSSVAANNSASQSSTRLGNYGLRPPTQPSTSTKCALELTESELSKKGGDLFKVGRDYVLFLESAASVARKSRQQQQQQVANVAAAAAAILDQWWLPFASHEPANNQTVRSVNRVLCKNCVRPPTVRLVNSTFVSVATNQQQQESQTTTMTTTTTAQQPGRRRIKLDCRVSGNPTPWVEWFRYGKPLRNKSGRTRIKTSVWKGRPNERLSRLELDLATGRNETGVYECRAMSVAAREPAVGTYKLLMLPAQFALVPMQQDLSGSNELGDEQQRRRGQKSATKTNNKADERDTKSPSNSLQTPTVAATAATSARPAEWAGSTTTPAPQSPPNQREHQQQQQQQQQGGSSNEDAARREGANQNGATGQTQQQQQQQNSSKSSPVVVGQPCPGEAHDNFCLNRGVCVLIGHIEEYFCNCAEGYHGHRCEYKSLGHQQNSH